MSNGEKHFLCEMHSSGNHLLIYYLLQLAKVHQSMSRAIEDIFIYILIWKMENKSFHQSIDLQSQVHLTNYSKHILVRKSIELNRLQPLLLWLHVQSA